MPRRPRVWLRQTLARRAILEALANLQGHPSAEGIFQAALKRSPRIGRATLFRALQHLVAQGFVRPMALPGGRTAYIVMAGGGHHHFVCLGCGATEELSSCPGCSQAVETADMEIRGHVLELFGLCSRCKS